MGGQKPGFFYENTSLECVDQVKNPVSLVADRSSLPFYPLYFFLFHEGRRAIEKKLFKNRGILFAYVCLLISYNLNSQTSVTI